MTMTADEERIVRTYVKDRIQQNMEIVQRVFDATEGSQEIRDKFIEIPLEETTVSDLMSILDSYKGTEDWNTIIDKSPIYNELHNQVREIFISGSVSFQDKPDTLLALQKSLHLKERSWSEWETTPITVLAEELRDTVGTALPKLHEDIKQALTTSDDLKPLRELVEWNDFLEDSPKTIKYDKKSISQKLTADQERKARTFICDRFNQSVDKFKDIFDLNEATKYIRDHFKKTEIPKDTTPQLIEILDTAANMGLILNPVTNRDPVYISLHDQARSMILVGSKSFKDKAKLLAFHNAFLQKKMDYAQSQSIPLNTLAKKLRDTFFLSIEKLHDDVMDHFNKSEDLKFMVDLIPWDNYGGTGAEKKPGAYSLNHNPGIDNDQYAAKLIGQIAGTMMTSMFENLRASGNNLLANKDCYSKAPLESLAPPAL